MAKYHAIRNQFVVAIAFFHFAMCLCGSPGIWIMSEYISAYGKKSLSMNFVGFTEQTSQCKIKTEFSFHFTFRCLSMWRMKIGSHAPSVEAERNINELAIESSKRKPP